MTDTALSELAPLLKGMYLYNGQHGHFRNREEELLRCERRAPQVQGSDARADIQGYLEPSA